MVYRPLTPHTYAHTHSAEGAGGGLARQPDQHLLPPAAAQAPAPQARCVLLHQPPEQNVPYTDPPRQTTTKHPHTGGVQPASCNIMGPLFSLSAQAKAAVAPLDKSSKGGWVGMHAWVSTRMIIIVRCHLISICPSTQYHQRPSAWRSGRRRSRRCGGSSRYAIWLYMYTCIHTAIDPITHQTHVPPR
jgi:hypothetical protein